MILPPCLTVGLLLFSSCLALLFTSSWCHRAWLWFRLITAFSLNPSLNWLVFQWQTVCTCACLRVLQSFSSLQRSVLPVVFLVTMISTAFIWLISVIFFSFSSLHEVKWSSTRTMIDGHFILLPVLYFSCLTLDTSGRVVLTELMNYF